jgi:hypothetical protein
VVSASEWYADRLRALMQRHGATAMDVERVTKERTGQRVAAYSVRNILAVKHQSRGPNRTTLERIAVAFGEDPAAAFPLPGSDDVMPPEPPRIEIDDAMQMANAMLIVDAIDRLTAAVLSLKKLK